MSTALAEYVRILGRGPGRSRSLTRAEAEAAMTGMLSGDAAPEAVGALLMLLRMKGETADEIAGFAHVAQGAVPFTLAADLDWPSYAAGRTRGLPWFLLSARLVALAGHRVVLHGWNGPDAAVREGLGPCAIATAVTAEEAEAALRAQGLVYLPLERVLPELFALLSLRDRLGLRSCVNTVCRMLNLGRAGASVQGVFHPSYRLLQADAAAILGWSALSVIKGGGGEFECNPSKDTAAFGLRDGAAWVGTMPARGAQGRRLSEAGAGATLSDVWSGETRDAFAEEVVIATAALALETLGDGAPQTRARALWDSRHDSDMPRRMRGTAA